MEIDHFSHEHRLTLVESENNISRMCTKLKCKACQKFCSVPLYACTQCSFYLHKSCAELPTEYQNPFHLHEPLILLFDVNRSFPCGACFKSCNGFYFHCKVCNFDLHVDCAILRLSVEKGCKQLKHSTHMHPLVLVEKKDEVVSRVKCLVCGEHCFGPCYGCDPCGVFLHQPCAEFQFPKGCKQLKHSTHMHPLVLVEKKDEVVNRVKCLVCGEHCFGPCYGCDPCGVFLHQPCAEFQFPKELNSFTHACPLALQTRVRPFRCRACDTCMLGICYHCERCLFYIDVECALLESIESNDGKQIKHFNHRHPLSLIEKFGDTDQVYCYACGEGCIGPTYVCNKCKGDFSLHKSCAGFAPKIYNVLHPYHPLTLLHRPTNTNQVVFQCKACCGDCIGLTYRCDLCDFSIHEKCAKKVPTIKYQGDKHLLLLVEMEGRDAKCKACKKSCEYGSSVVRCLQCDFNLHVWCGPLPSTIKHKHIDDLTLVESPVEDESDDESHCDEFYCDVCEGEGEGKEYRDPRLPIYYCAGCRYVAEVSCVISEVTLWLKGEYGDVELRTGGGKIVGKVISKRQEIEKMCEVEAAQESKLHRELGVGERLVRHDLLTLDRFANLYNEIFQKEAAQEIKIDGMPALAWKHIKKSFSEDELKELHGIGLFMTKERKIISAEEKSFDEQDSPYIPIFLDEAFKEFKRKLDAGPKKLMELWEAEEERVNVRDYLVPQSLVCILESLFAKYGDVSVEFTLSSSRVKMFLYVILCGTIDRMCETRVLDISEDDLIHWWTYLKALQSAGFKIQFAFDYLNRVVQAYYGLRLKKQVHETLSQLKRDITVRSAQLEELTKKLDLLKYKEKSIMLEESGKKSDLIDECLKEASRLKWRKAGQGLQLKLN